MFGTYWNDASVLRAALIQAGVPEDLAASASVRIAENYPIWWLWTRAMAVVAFSVAILIALVAQLERWLEVPTARKATAFMEQNEVLFSGYVAAGGSVVPIEIGLIALSMLLFLLFRRSLARLWADYGYLRFADIALNQSTAISGPYRRWAMRAGSGTTGRVFLLRVATFGEGVLSLLAAAVICAIVYLFSVGTGVQAVVTPQAVHTFSGVLPVKEQALPLSAIKRADIGCEMKGPDTSPIVTYRLTLPEGAAVDVSRLVRTQTGMVRRIADIHYTLQEARIEAGQPLEIVYSAAPDCMEKLVLGKSLDERTALSSLFSGAGQDGTVR